MKKIILPLIAILFGSYIYAQSNIVSSTSRSITTVSVSEPKPQPEPSPSTEWFVRTGLNIMNFAGDGGDGLDSKVGYDATFGFQKPIGIIGAYWGMEFGAGSRGAKYKETNYEENLIAHNIRISPFTFGWKYGVTEEFKIDAHLGTFFSYDYTGKMKIEYRGYEYSYKLKDWDDWNSYDVGINVGFGVWYNRYNLDFTFQRGFIETFDDNKSYTNNFMIRLGISF
ncbi:MAG: PorT family protein [Rikenellaceae bacterium]|nr:PorT family protein [Rikenellaceae bacterium]